MIQKAPKIPLFITTWLSLFHLPLALSASGNTQIPNFSTAKKEVYQIFHQLGGTTLYCGCRFNRDKTIIPNQCSYSPKRRLTKKGKINPRTQKTEIEHIVAAHAFGQSFSEWRNPKSIPKCHKKNGKFLSPRKCAATNKEFSRMEADMYNLWPAIGEINAARSNFRMAIIPGEKREFGSCDIEIENRKIEPREEVRGIIARAFLYMDRVYPGRGVLQRQGGTRKMIEEWNTKYPPTPFEKKWALQIMKLQGNCQPFIMNCQPIQK